MEEIDAWEHSSVPRFDPILCQSTEPRPLAPDPLFEELYRANGEKQRGAPLRQDDRLGHRYLRPLTSAHGHAQAGRTEREADQAGEGSDPGATGRALWFQSAIHKRFGARSTKPTPRLKLPGNLGKRSR